MKISNKKLISASILIFASILLFSTLTYAKPFTDAFRGGLIQINDFFTKEQYKTYAQAIDFFFFSLLFIAIYMMGARYSFKEVKRPETVIVILLGLMTGFLMVLGGWSATLILPYLNWLLYTLLFILYWWLLKGIKNKFWRFVLALLLTLLTIALLQGLFGALTAPEVGKVDTGFFQSLAEAFKGIQIPGVSYPGVPDYLTNLFGLPTVTTPAPTGPVTLPPTVTPVAPPEEKRGFPWWGWLLILLGLALAAYGAKKGYDALRRRAPPQPPTTPTMPTPPAEEITIENILEGIRKIEEQKKKVIEKITKVEQEKTKAMSILAHFKEVIAKVKDKDRAWLIAADHKAFEAIHEEEKRIVDLLKLEIELENDLKELMKLENNLLVKADEWQAKITASITEPELQNHKVAITKVISKLKEIITKEKGIKWLIARYFYIDKREEEITSGLEQLLNEDNLEQRLKEKWSELKNKSEDALTSYFEIEKAVFNSLNKKIIEENKLLNWLKKVLQYILAAEKINTKVEIVKIEPEEATNLDVGVNEGTRIIATAKITNGVPPFKSQCYLQLIGVINGIERGAKIIKLTEQDIAKKDNEFYFGIDTGGILGGVHGMPVQDIGLYYVIISAVGSGGLKKSDFAKVKIRINSGIGVHGMPSPREGIHGMPTSSEGFEGVHGEPPPSQAEEPSQNLGDVHGMVGEVERMLGEVEKKKKPKGKKPLYQ